MRIISDFHDYYDAVQAAGQDQTLIYFRKREEEIVSDYSLPVIEWSVWLRDSRGSGFKNTLLDSVGRLTQQFC